MRGRELVSRANEIKEDGLLTSVWTIDGKIFVKTSPSGDPVRIFRQPVSELVVLLDKTMFELTEENLPLL